MPPSKGEIYLSEDEVNLIKELRKDTPTRDLVIPSLLCRDRLIKKGLAFKHNGFTFLTPDGEVERLLLLNDAELMDRTKISKEIQPLKLLKFRYKLRTVLKT